MATRITNRSFTLELREDLSFILYARATDLAMGRPQFESRSALPSRPDQPAQVETETVLTPLGQSHRTVGRVAFGPLGITLTVDQYDEWPDAFVLQWEFENRGADTLRCFPFQPLLLQLGPALKPDLWTMQAISTNWGQDFTFQLPSLSTTPEPGAPGVFYSTNDLRHQDNGEGGGIPLVYFWNRIGGLALAHIEPEQAPWTMPVRVDGTKVEFGFEYPGDVVLAPGQTFRSPRMLISFHKGDFFGPLALYRDLLARQGVSAPAPNREDYEPAWCSWGYEFDVRPEEMTGVLPILKELGIHWLTLDDRWFDAYGDWNPRPETFPGGAVRMKTMVDAFHAAGAKAQIWWYPLCVEDGHGQWESHPYGVSELLRRHPDWLILNPDGQPARNNRHLAMLCPAVPGVQEHTLAMLRRFIQDWGFDGHKLDNIYTVPACHNPAHHHARPEESVEAFGRLYREIFAETRRLRPDSVTQICPCGTPITHTLLPATDQTVTADPINSAQVRQRIKFYKALTGPRAPVFADHVELSDGGLDFASAVGTGGIPSTKFVWPPDKTLRSRLKEYWLLTPEKQALFEKWFALSREHALADGETLNLYDIAFDKPEAHVIRKERILYYAFYADRIDQAFTGEVELRGLREGEYRVRDYINGRELGRVRGPLVRLQVVFTGSLLLQALPVE